jgi:glutamate-1-semialdehyde 2,1-aminomutase
LAPDYIQRTRESGELFDRAKKVFAGGVNHNARLYRPYPLFVSRARGSQFWDEDGNSYVDYWMGHTALILGHSPEPVVDALQEQVAEGTLFGMGSRLSVELGEAIQRDVPCAEMVRFCNTGAEATMYLVRLARAFTRRKTVMKIAGGWHGYNTDLNKGVHSPFDKTEGEGILPSEQADVLMVRFNDLADAERAFRRAGGDVAVVFLEPVLGAGGCVPAERDYLKGLRELTERNGALLAFDEIITGYRLGLGGAQQFFGVKPDLATLGKVVGGGLPIGLVCGRREIVSMADPSRKEHFVSIGGGTFSENPLSMAAGLATVKYLRRRGPTLYSKLEKEGRRVRTGLDRIFRENGMDAHTTGVGSLFLTHFGKESSEEPETKETVLEYGIHLMENGIFLLPGHPCAISAAHRKKELDLLLEKAGDFAETKGKGTQNRKAKVTA